MNDEKLIRKHYGEKMWHFCRDNFSTILEEPKRLYNLLTSLFYPNHFLYDDLKENELLVDFKTYIITVFNKETCSKKEIVSETPQELLRKVGYTLYECDCEEDIQYFKKYYKKEEALCTFRTNRLNDAFVFFAVRDGAEQLNRDDFTNPRRQDEYGTSVISIQFSRDKSHALSIKNRYNHTVINCDSTYANNLENIIPGLTESFERFYGLKSSNTQTIEIPNYVQASDGKFYKFNKEVNGKYYCNDNIIIDFGRIITKYQNKSRYLFVDYFILDLQEKKIIQYDKSIEDDFINVEKDIKKIDVSLENGYRVVKIYHDNGISILKLNKNNGIVQYYNDWTKKIGDRFLAENTALQKITCLSLRKIGKKFIDNNRCINEVNLPELISIDSYFLYKNRLLEKLSLPKLKKSGMYFLSCNSMLKEISLPELLIAEEGFLQNNMDLEEIDLPNVLVIESNFLRSNNRIKKFIFNKLYKVGDFCFYSNKVIRMIDAPNLKSVGFSFLCNISGLDYFNMPSLEHAEEWFLEQECNLREINLPNLKYVGRAFLYSNVVLKKILIPNAEVIEDYFLYENRELETLSLSPNVEIEHGILYNWRYTHSDEELSKLINNEITINKIKKKD